MIEVVRLGPDAWARYRTLRVTVLGRRSTMPPPREHIEELELALSLPRAP